MFARSQDHTCPEEHLFFLPEEREERFYEQAEFTLRRTAEFLSFLSH